MSVPVASDRVFWSPQTVFRLSGVTQIAVGKVSLKWGFDIHRELVTGANLGYYGTGGFKGEMEFDGLGSSDSRWDDAAAVTSGIAPTFGMTAQERDTEGIGASGARTWTVSGKFTQYEKMWDKDMAVRYKLKGEMVTVPTVVQS